MLLVQSTELEQVRQPGFNKVRFFFQFASRRIQGRFELHYRAAG
jgi:hypothetical protein